MLINNYIMEEVTFTKATADKITVVNPRKIRKSQVNNILSQLVDGKHFDSNLVVNELRGTNLRVIDGRHRIEAMRLYFKLNPNEKMKIWIAKYRNLTPDEERRIYTLWNISIRQSTDDFINSYKDDIKIFPKLLEKIPCSIYACPNKIKIKDLINAYLASHENPYKGGSLHMTSYDFVKEMKKMDEKSVDEIKENFDIIYEIFNPEKLKDFTKLSPFKNIIFRALYYLVQNNKKELGDYMKRRMLVVLARKTILEQYQKYHGRSVSVEAYNAFKDALNRTDSPKKFV